MVLANRPATSAVAASARIDLDALIVARALHHAPARR
jgi:hypothetical protein